MISTNWQRRLYLCIGLGYFTKSLEAFTALSSTALNNKKIDNISCQILCATAESRKNFSAKLISLVGFPLLINTAECVKADSVTSGEVSRRSPRPFLYRVDFTNPPTMVPFPERLESRVEQELLRQQLVFIGYHSSGSTKDFVLGSNIIERLNKRKRGKLLIGLEHVQQKFQAALDTYIFSDDNIDQEAFDNQLRAATEWDSKQSPSFESILPIFRLARANRIPLVALGLNSESIVKVAEGGLEGLSVDERNQYVIDLKGFIEYERLPGFKVYAGEVLYPAFEKFSKQGSDLKKSNFFALRILSDEAVASRVVEAITEKQGYTMIVLQDIEHLKFGFGTSGRALRIAENLGGTLGIKSVILNPTAMDSNTGTTNLRLSLALADDLYEGKSFGDYIWYSDRPYVNQLTHLMNEEDSEPIWNRIKLGYD